jgi:cell division protein FtsB
MSSALSHSLKRHKNLMLTAASLAVLVWAAFHGKAGLEELREKHRRIQELEQQNAALEQEVAARRERIQRLANNPEEQDLEIRKLNLLKPGETTFILPGAEKQRLEEQKGGR